MSRPRITFDTTDYTSFNVLGVGLLAHVNAWNKREARKRDAEIRRWADKCMAKLYGERKKLPRIVVGQRRRTTDVAAWSTRTAKANPPRAFLAIVTSTERKLELVRLGVDPNDVAVEPDWTI